MIKLDAVINDKKLLASIQKGVDSYNRSRAGKSKLNLKINEKGFRQPLGRITGDIDKFESALAASNARVIAFGASTAVIGGVSKAFKSLLATTDKVQKQFADINRILGASNRQFEEFSGRLFDIGKKTATTFDDASKAALEFARQGLSLNETLKRTSDALTLVRLTGVNADKAVSALTATVNAFQHSSLTTTEALNKFIAVETKYAVSAKDLMEGLGRVGSAAVDAKVSFDELNAMIAAVQQQTGRGGAVIGNAMKTIFTRLQRRETLEALESYNVAVRDIDGNTRPAMAILQDFAKTYKTLSDANKAYLREQVAGVFQANILSAIVKDLNSNMQVYGRSLETSTSATNEAAMANAKLNQTLNAMLSQTGTELVRLQENIGKVTLEPIAKALLGPFKSIMGDINHLLDGEGLGSDLANGVLKGIRNILAGPGLVAAVSIIGITIFKTLSYITKALPTLVGITNETQKRAQLEASISAMLSTDAGLTAQIAKAEGNAAVQAGILLGAAEKAKVAFAAQATSTAAIAANLAAAGMTTNKMGAIVPKGRGAFGRGASGFIPGVAGEMHDIRRGTGGVSPSARPVHIPNFAFGGGQHGSMVANTGEHIVPNFRGGGSAIFNPAMVRANGGLPQGAKRITAAQGYVPNFAPLSAQPAIYQKGLTTLRGGSLSGVNTQADTLERMGHPDLARKLRAGMAAKKTQREKGAAQTAGAKSKNLYSIPAREVGIGAIVGMKSRKGPYSPRQSFSTILGPEGAVKHDPKLRKYMMANPHKSVQITNIPVGGLSTLGTKSTDQGDAGQRLKQAFTKKLNKFMLPGLNNYTSSIFKSLLNDDGQSFIRDLQNNRQRVFSTSVEGGIFESALQLASRNAKNFSGDDIARFDFEESGRISPMLRKTFFSRQPGVRRADAKRSDSSPNILSLIGKSFGTAATSKAIRSWPALATDMAAWEKTQTAQKGRRAGGGYVPNFAGGGLGAAISREKASGVPSSSIRINSDPRFSSIQNPAGLAVTNTYDEPRGLRDVPNFADVSTSAGVMRSLKASSSSIAGPFPDRGAMAAVNKASMSLAQALADGTMNQKQVTRTLGKLGGRVGMSDKALTELNGAITKASTQLQSVAAKAKATAGGGPAGAGAPRMAGMGGMALMMGAPMVGGILEQQVGGRAGAGISGALTGGVMGGVMGGMLAGAVSGSAAAPGIGTAIGAGVGVTAGIIAAFSADADSASQALTEFAGKLESTGKSADAFIASQKAMVSATTAEDFDNALVSAARALYDIDDPELRKNLKENGTEFGKLTEIVKRYRVEQERELLLKKSSNEFEKKLNKDIADEDKTFSPKDPKTRDASIRGLSREVLGPIAEFLRRSGKEQGLTRNEMLNQALQIQNAIKTGRTEQNDISGRIERFGQGLFDEQTIYDKLLGIGQPGSGGGKITQGSRIGEVRGSLDPSAAGDIAKIFGAQLDPGVKAGVPEMGTGGVIGTEKLLFSIGEKMLAFVLNEQLDLVENLAKKGGAAQSVKANYTKALSALFTSIDETILERADTTRKTQTNLARRSARVAGRASMFGKAKDPFDLAVERRDTGLDDISIKKTLVESQVITANAKKLQAIIDKVGDGAQRVLDRLKKTVSSRFLSGDFTGAMEGLMAETTKTGGTFQGKNVGKQGLRLNTSIIKAITDFNRNLGEDLAKREATLTKEEKLLLDKFREDQVRAELVESERDINLQKQKYLAGLEIALTREEAAASSRITSIDQRLRDPRETRFMRSGAAFGLQRGLEREKITEQQALEKKRLQVDVQQRNAEIIATQLTTKSTLNLVAVNLKLIKALDDNTVAAGGTPSTGGAGEGASPGASHPSGVAKAGRMDRETFDKLPEAAKSRLRAADPSGDFLKPQTIEIPKAEKLVEYKSKDYDFTQKILADSEAIQKSLQHQIQLQDVLTGKKEKQLETTQGSVLSDFDSDTKFGQGSLKSQTKFSEGIKTGLGAVWTDSEGIFNKLGTDLPMQFRNNMVGAMEAAMDKTSSLGDALDGVALAFLSTMRQAFLQSAVSNMMSAGSTLFGVDLKQRGGAIRAQNGMFVGGSGSGDKHPALLESGEYVLNRNAVGALGGPAALDSINFGMAPRFQKGGGHLMALSEKLPSSRMSGLFLQQGNPEYNEIADKAQERMQKAQEKHAKKEQRKAMILSTIISGVMAAGMGAASKGISKWKSTKVPGSNWWGGIPEDTMAIGNQTGGFIRRQSGGSIGGGVARRYGLFQGGGSVPVSSGAPSLGGSTNTNNISINIGLGGDNESAGSGASQTATGNTGAPSQATTADAKALSQKIKSQVLKILTEEQRVGGILSPTARRA
jgi:TP901 family phage tail tape measure protein